MSSPSFPVVTIEALHALDLSIGDSDSNEKVLNEWLRQMEEENPLLMETLYLWAQKQADTKSALKGAVLVYQCLRAQSVANSTNF